MPDATELRTGDPAEVAGYRIVRRLGQGGQGVVFLGLNPDGERVAIKQLRLEDERSRQQFAKEVAAARRVAPFCTARIITFDLEGESPYVVSEFIEGPSLQRLVRDSGPIAGTRLERLAIGTVTALAAIHQAGVVHRDFKPANVMMSPEGPRVIDFGIARDLSSETTVTSRIFGTPAYMAPEQIRAERVSPQTDMFAWASVMAFAATGRAPFDAQHMMAVVHRITTMEPQLDGVPAGLVDVLTTCLHKDARRRPTAQQALAMLLGRPTPAYDVTDAGPVLAEASRIAQANTGGPAGAVGSADSGGTGAGAAGAAGAVGAGPGASAGAGVGAGAAGQTGRTAPTAWTGQGSATARTGSADRTAPTSRNRLAHNGERGNGHATGHLTGQSSSPTSERPTGQSSSHAAGHATDRTAATRRVAPGDPHYGTPPPPGAPREPGARGVPDRTSTPRPDRTSTPVVPSRRRRSGPVSSLGAVLALLLIGGGLVAGGAFAVRAVSNHGRPTAGDTGPENGGLPSQPESTGVPAPSSTTSGQNTDGQSGEGGPSSGASFPGGSTPAGSTPAVTLPGGGAGTGLPAWSSGIWSGPVSQPLGQVTSWDAVVTLDQGATTGKIAIDDLGCSGVLTYVSGGDDSVEMTTHLEDDLWDSCADTSTVVLTRSGANQILFSWQDDSEESNKAVGTLTHQ
ncbi:protein kinase [Kineosporia sp. J2-2]|uniref:non-specific serine/threonine protein kinase n=1 Tax=Kineosporia corallincola TaxID=2835133 RepID=A0ABS5TSJ6_9ACTN|nr:serine/threonine-protein kinase [Kineosporia corallincola]MBT0773794.1 protein kinase [Kineosporia corallincola]